MPTLCNPSCPPLPAPSHHRRRSSLAAARTGTLLFASLIALPIVASEPTRANEPAPPAPAVTATIDQLAWMAGSWRGEPKPGRSNEETWMAPGGGAMLGVHRDVSDGRMTGFEFLRIAADASGVPVYWASPGGAPPTPFRLVEVAGERVVFANPDHDFPQRILYWRDAAGNLHARIEGPQGNETVGMEWTWQPVTPCP